MMKLVKHIAILILLMVSLLPLSGSAQWTDNVQIMTAQPGDMITFNGRGTPCTEAMMDITTSVVIDASYTNGQWLYDTSMNNVKILNGKNSFSISAYPVNTMTVWGSFRGLTISRNAGVSGGKGSFSINNVPAATYNIGVRGIAQGQKVHLDVHAQGKVKVNKDGKLSACLSTSGMPAGVYSVCQNGMPVATVYLGVSCPDTPTATPTPTVCPSPSAPCVPDRIIVPSTPVAVPCISNDKLELASDEKVELASEDLAETAVPPVEVTVAPQSEVPKPNTPVDDGIGLNLVLTALALCGICGVGGYFLLFKKK